MRRGLLVSLVCVLVLPRSGTAQEAADQLHPSWGIMAGGVGVTGAYRGLLSSGASIGGAASFPLASSRLAIRADVLFHYIGWYQDGCNRGDIDCGLRPGGSSTAVSGSLGLVARLNEAATKWSPYVIGGVATYYFGGADGPLTWMRPNHFGFQGGVGFEVRPARQTYFVEMRYLGIPPGGIVPITVGVRF